MGKKSKTLSGVQKKENRAGFLFILPALISFLLFLVIPAIMMIVLTFFKYNLVQPPVFVGLDNFSRLFRDQTALATWKNTLKFVAILVPMHCGVGLILAYMVSRVFNKTLKNLYRGIIYFPVIVTTASVSIVWNYMFATDLGLINYYIRKIGFSNVAWMTDANVIYWTIALFSFWKFIGTTFLYYFVGIQNIPTTYYEAAKIDGASDFKIFFNITLPLLTPTIFFVIITNVIGVFQIFDEPFLLTNGGPGIATKTFSMYIYEKSFKPLNSGYGNVLSLIIFIVILAITLIQFRGQQKWVVYDYE